MKQLFWLFVIAGILPALLCAGPVYGTILFNSAALGGATISVACGGVQAGAGATLDDGSYRIGVRGQGRCIFTLTSRRLPGAVSTEIVSLQDAALYNFDVVVVNGRYQLRRR